MKIELIRGALSHPRTDPCVIALGFFDGVHQGHAALVAPAVQAAADRKLPAFAYTFDPHPRKVLRPETAPKILTTLPRRIDLLGGLGLDGVVVEPFTAAFSKLTPEAWVSTHLVEALRVAHVVVGFNFRFGHRGAGSPELLRKLGEQHGFEVTTVSPVRIEGAPVSSSRVRQCLEEGDMSLAQALLGRPASLEGLVSHGDGRGRTLGIRTANIVPEEELQPKPGVYAGYLEETQNGRKHRAVMNVGYRPTFEHAGYSVEAHLFEGPEGLDLYQTHARIQFMTRLRDEQKFDGPEALVKQIQEDIAEARAVLAEAEAS